MRAGLLLRRIEYHLNHLYILDRFPLVLVVVFCLLMAFVARLGATFTASYHKRPILTMMVSNSILMGIADSVAQGVTIVRERAMRKGQNTGMSVELHELEKHLPSPVGKRDIIPNSDSLPPPFDGLRLFRFIVYGFGMGSVQFKWYQLLERTFPLVKGSIAPAIKRVAADQLFFAPVGIGVFYVLMSALEGKSWAESKYKLNQVYTPTVKANWMLWPAVQTLNFSVIPLQYQLPLVSTVNIAWTCYLSAMNSGAGAKPVQLD